MRHHRNIPNLACGAFSLVEILVSIVVIGVLLSLAIGAIQGSRASARRLRCLANIRSAGQLIFTYGTQQKDALPFGGYERRTVLINGVVRFTLGGRAGVPDRGWTALFPEEWTGWVWNPALRCPMQPPCSAVIEPTMEQLGTWYRLSSAVWMDAKTLAATSSPALVKPKANTFADVTYPSRKVLLYESRAYCQDTATNLEWIAMGQTPFEPSSTLCIDGSARRTIQANGLPALRTMPYNYTIDGVHGRDLP